ncbi:putative exosortase-affiliated protein, TIGR04073 family [Methylocaldum marinum]|uniref:Putative exosortase-affiliated protein, TIGR04073 family n=1 Tax=Methylocaldum marinum TaxID=1432792 RepID=A0A250KZD2_9GAMM|nr:putative exosortase-affiliated protein, TIGR04073 family [Methylocaldum marinum]
MCNAKSFFLAAVLAMAAYTPASQADGYFSQVGDKFTRGFANLFTGIGEVPKNIAGASKKTNPVVGGTGGLIMGTLDTLGRTASGVFDIITSPIPTKSLVEPAYVWENFDQNTSYGDAYL